MGLVEKLEARVCGSSGESAHEWGLKEHPVFTPTPKGPATRRIMKEEIVVSNCCECLLRDKDNTCMGADDGQVVNCPKTGRSCDCPLFEKTYVIRGA
jgi:hypothetical protein